MVCADSTSRIKDWKPNATTYEKLFNQFHEALAEIFPLFINKVDFHCKVYEDNQSCIAKTELSKLTHRTKHIALKWHHFQAYVNSKRIRVTYTQSEDQFADILTKPLPDFQFFVLSKMICSWWNRHSVCKGVLHSMAISQLHLVVTCYYVRITIWKASFWNSWLITNLK